MNDRELLRHIELWAGYREPLPLIQAAAWLTLSLCLLAAMLHQYDPPRIHPPYEPASATSASRRPASSAAAPSPSPASTPAPASVARPSFR